MATPELLTVTRKSDKFDVTAIERFLTALPFSFVDPQDASTYLLCGNTYETVDAYKRRLSGATSMPYVCIVNAGEEAVEVSLMCDEEASNQGKQFLDWLLSNYSCRVLDEDGDDVTDAAYAKLDSLFTDD